MNHEKASFLRTHFVDLLKEVPSDRKPRWGKMSFQQMVEHFVDVMRIASGRLAITQIMTPPERLPAMREFMMSNKPFRENTPNPLLPEVPAPVKNRTVAEAIESLEKEISYFFEVFEKNNLPHSRNPFFGDLSFSENIQLLYKHALHHLRQFGVDVEQQ